MKIKTKNRIVAVIQLVILTLGMLCALLTPISWSYQTTRADNVVQEGANKKKKSKSKKSKSHGGHSLGNEIGDEVKHTAKKAENKKSGKSKKSDSKNGDNNSDSNSDNNSDNASDSSSDSNSNSDDSKKADIPAPLKNMMNELGRKNNLLNPNFPNAVKQAAFGGGALKYNQSAQVLITYAILKGSYPSKYADLYKTGQTTTQSLSKELPGLQLKKMGTDQFVQDLDKAANTEGGGNPDGKDGNTNSSGDGKKSGPTKADEIETSSFPTDMKKDEWNKWANSNKGTSELFEKVAGQLSQHAINACSIEGDKVAYHDDAHYYDTHGGLKALVNGGKNCVNGSYNFLKETVNSATLRGNDNATFKADWHVGYTSFHSGVNSPMKGTEGNVKQAMAADLVNALGDSSILRPLNSKAKLQAWLNKQSAASVGKDKVMGRNSDSGEWPTQISSIAQIKYANPNAKNFIGTIGKSEKTTANKFISEHGNLVSGVQPNAVSSLIKDGAHLGEWGSNFTKEINTKAHVTVTDDEWNAFKKLRDNTLKNAKNAKDATKGDQVLSWAPVIPYSDKWSNKDGAFASGYSQQGGVLMRDSSHWAALNGFMLTSTSESKNPLFVRNVDPTLSVGGNSGATLGGDPINKIAALGNTGGQDVKNHIKEGLSKLTGGNNNATLDQILSLSFKENKKPSDHDIYGIDSYGDILDGSNQDMRVVIPYWQNPTVKDFDCFKSPMFVSTPMPIKASDFPSTNAESKVSDKDIEAIDKQDAKTIEKVRDKVKGATSQQQFYLKANKAVGQSGGSSLSQKAAACLAVIVTAGTQDKVKSWNNTFLDDVQKGQQCYIGESIDADKNNNSQKKGNGLYTAADLIQRMGLYTDVGFAGPIRKTLVGLLVSAYNNDFVQNGTQNIFASQVYGDNDELSQLGVAPYFWIMIIITIVICGVTVFQFHFGKVKATAFVTRFIKAFIFILAFALIGMGVIPQFEEWCLNLPIQVTSNKIIKRESVLDQWDKLREQKQINNVFYADLMQDSMGKINRTKDYLIPFYTSTLQDGEVDPSVSDPRSPNYANIQTAGMHYDSEQDQLADSRIYREGDGKVPPLTPYRYKKVYVTLADLTDWASHMARQKLSAEGAQGFQKGDADYEQPAAGYKPGEEPLFTWLAKDYQPISTTQDDTSSDDASDAENTKNGLNGNNGPTNNPADTNSKSSNKQGTDSDSNNDQDPNSANADVLEKIQLGTFDQAHNVIAYADDNSGNKRDKLMQLANSRVNKVPYVWGGTNWDSGMDCSGFVQQCYKKIGINIPHFSGAQYQWAMSHGGKKESLSDAKPGDLVFEPANSGSEHVQIVAGGGQIIEEPCPGKKCEKVPEWIPKGSYTVVNMDAQLGSSGGNDSSSNSSDNSNNNSNSSDSNSDQQGWGNYGKVRNPADTFLKSAYNGLSLDSQSGATGDTGGIDNSEMYAHLDKYAEFAVNTKHYPDASAARYHLDSESGGGKLTASQAFLALWEQVFQNSGKDGDPGDAQSFTALMNFADAMNSNTKAGSMEPDQTTDDTVGQKDQGNTTDSTQGKSGEDVNKDTVGQVGRNDLINQLSMTQYQRKVLNGGNGGYSKAAQQMINEFKIPAGKSDYFNLDQKGSIIDLMDPYQKGEGKARDGLIFSINKKALNDYVTIYSTVRKDIDPTDANSSDDSGNNQPNQQGVDPFTMAEDQVMAADIFFTVNQKLHYRMFPTGYDPHSITLNSWDRMLFIPIKAMKQLNDDSQYDMDDKTSAAKIALQDNVVEYIALNSSIPALIVFLIMNIMLTIFGWVLKIFFVWFFPIFLVLTFLRMFVFTRGSGKGIFTGSVFAVFVFAMLKLGLGFVFETLSNLLNTSFDAANGYTEMHVLSFSLVVCVYMLLAYWLIWQYLLFIIRHFWTLGVDESGNPFKSFGRQLANSKMNPLRRFTNRRYSNARDRFRNRRRGRWGKAALIGAAGLGAGAISHVVRHGVNFAKAMGRNIRDSKAMAKASDGLHYFKHQIFGGEDAGFARRMKDMYNAKTGSIKATDSNGLALDKVSAKDNGEHIDDVQGKTAHYDLNGLTPEALDDLNDVIAENDLGNRFAIDRGARMLIAKDLNDKMLNSAEGRKEAMQPLVDAIETQAALAHQRLGNGKVKNWAGRSPLIGMEQNGDDSYYTIPIDAKNGVDPKAVKRLLRSRLFRNNFQLVSEPARDAKGNYLNGELHIIPANGDVFLNKLNTQHAFSALQDAMNQYTGKEFQRQTGKQYINVGNDNKLNNTLRKAGLKVINGRVYGDQDDLAKADMLLKKQRNNHFNTYGQMGDALSQYVLHGNNHGLSIAQMDADEAITKRFKTMNNGRVQEAMRGLNTLGRSVLRTNNGIRGIQQQANETQNLINNVLKDNANGTYGLAQQYATFAKNNNIRLSGKAQELIKSMNAITKAAGTTNEREFSPSLRLQMDNRMHDLTAELQKNSQLNQLQTGLLSRIDGERDSRISRIVQQREQLLRNTGIPASEANQLFQNMTPKEIGDYATLSTLVADPTVDRNGVLSLKIAPSNNSRRTQERISTLIKSINKS